MFFCPNCNNMFDIARSIPQSGKGIKEKKNEETDSQKTDSQEMLQNTLQEIIEETALLQKTHEDTQKGGDIYDDLVQKILNNQPIDETDIKNININDITKSQTYKKLKIKNKEYVDNKIQDLLPLNEKKVMKDKVEKSLDELSAYFVCNNCGYAIKIKPSTKIFSRTSEDISQNYAVSDYGDLLYSDIVPRTRKYICPNKKCESHKDNSKREAIFFRLNNTYKIKYICCTCKTDF